MHIRPWLTAVVVASLIAGLSSAAPAAAQTSPTFTVEPDTSLVDGQPVRYDGTGFPSGQGFAILQCIPGATSLTEVLAKCQVRQSVTADATGSFSGFVTVQRTFRPMTGSVDVDCAAAAQACAITAFDMSSRVFDAPVSFADPSTPRPELSVSPAADLEDGDIVTVTGTNFPAGADVTVAQCMVNRPATAEWCDDRPPVDVGADAAGGFVVELTIHRGITTPSGVVTDCAADATTPCAITAFTGDGATWATSPIDLVYRRVLAMASNPLVVSPQGTIELTGIVFCSVAGPLAVEVSGVVSQTVEDRVVSAEFHATSSCLTAFGSWSTQVGGSREQRFKVGDASVTAWAVDETDPVPDDAQSATTYVQLVRAQA